MFIARVIEDIDNGKGCWKSQKIGIFDFRDDNKMSPGTKVGEFVRNYHAYGVSTFTPFERNGKWYALYSKNYTEIALMELPSCKKIGAIGGKGHSFCPVEIWVPRYSQFSFDVTNRKGEKSEHTIRTFLEEESKCERRTSSLRFEGSGYAEFALISGCVWGDDTSWKLVMVDLRDLNNIAMKQSFGYCELGPHKLRDCVEIEWDKEYGYDFTVSVLQQFSLEDLDDTQYEKYVSYEKKYVE